MEQVDQRPSGLRGVDKSAIAANADPQPSVFLSYSWEDDEHAAWISTLAQRLSDKGISILSDNTAVRPGDEFAPFMEKICDADRVLVVCTPSYKIKADGRIGGVGYETRLLVARLIKDQKNTKAILLLRKGSWEESAPKWVGTARYLDFRATPPESAYATLLDRLRSKSADAVPNIDAPKPPSLSPAPRQFALFAGFFGITVLILLDAMMHPQMAFPAASIADQVKLWGYAILTLVRIGAAYLLLRGSRWLIRSEYQNGAAPEAVSTRARAVLGFSVLAATAGVSSLLNLTLSGFNVVPDGAPFMWPELLSYGFLVGGGLTLAWSLWNAGPGGRRFS